MTVRRHTEDGTTWSELSRLDPLAAVLDPGDARGAKNSLIDRIHKRALAHAIGDVRGHRALDFGSGTGRLTDFLARQGAIVDAVDVTREMLDVAHVRIPWASYCEIDGRELPFRSASFDLAVSAYVLQYYVSDTGNVVSELARVLRPDGRLIAIEQVSEHNIGRGGALDAYLTMFDNAGFRRVQARRIRLSDSKTFRMMNHFPALSRIIPSPWLVESEAKLRSWKALRHHRYADVCFSASR